MNVHVVNSADGRETGGFQFEIGTFVDHREGGWLAFIVDRQRATKNSGKPGPEIYTLKMIEGQCRGEIRYMMGDVLQEAV